MRLFSVGAVRKLKCIISSDITPRASCESWAERWCAARSGIDVVLLYHWWCLYLYNIRRGMTSPSVLYTLFAKIVISSRDVIIQVVAIINWICEHYMLNLSHFLSNACESAGEIPQRTEQISLGAKIILLFKIAFLAVCVAPPHNVETVILNNILRAELALKHSVLQMFWLYSRVQILYLN